MSLEDTVNDIPRDDLKNTMFNLAKELVYQSIAVVPIVQSLGSDTLEPMMSMIQQGDRLGIDPHVVIGAGLCYAGWKYNRESVQASDEFQELKHSKAQAFQNSGV